MGELTHTEFPFKTSPYKHQLECWRLCRDLESYALFMEMGTGKSKVVIDNAGYLFLKEKIKGHVVVAPKGVYMNWVDGEIPIHLTDAVQSKVAYWSSYARKGERDAIRKLHEEGNFLRTLAVNVEALNSERAADVVVEFLKKYPSMMTIDESTTVKNPSAKRTKIATNIGKFAKYRRICSGNPMPNGPLDLYSQTEFLKHNLMGFSNFFAFRNRFAVMQEQKLGNRSFKRVVGFRESEHLKQIMRRFSFICKKADCLDLPPKLYQTVDVSMGEQQTRAYNQMLEESVVKLNGELMTAEMVITQMLRLHQIACGFIKPDASESEVSFEEPNERLETLMNLLEQAPGKVIIWATYRYNIRQILTAIKAKFGFDSVVEYYGDTSMSDRYNAKVAFQDPTSPVKFMVSNPDTGKWGNTWTQATTVIYYSNSYNLEAREQSEDRAHRIGQKGAIHDIKSGDGILYESLKSEDEPSVLYLDLRVRGTVDDRILRILKNKKKLTDEIVASNWKWLIGEPA